LRSEYTNHVVILKILFSADLVFVYI
jgi:hypothetical protein